MISRSPKIAGRSFFQGLLDLLFLLLGVPVPDVRTAAFREADAGVLPEALLGAVREAVAELLLEEGFPDAVREADAEEPLLEEALL